MKLNRNYIILLIIIIVIALSFSSCDFIVDSSKSESAQQEKKEILVQNKNEAKILVQASEYGLDVIELCDLIKKKAREDSIKKLLDEIKEEQLKIFEKYQEVASTNVITLPRYSNLTENVETDLSTSKDLEMYLNLMNSKIYYQQDLIQKLSKTTDNSSFKILAEYALESLKTSMKKTNETLEELNKNT